MHSLIYIERSETSNQVQSNHSPPSNIQSNGFVNFEQQQSQLQSQLMAANSARSSSSSSISESLKDIKNDKSMTPFERMQAAKARIQMQQQGRTNQKIMSAQDTTTFIDKYAQGGQMSAGFSGMNDGNRNSLGSHNSYRVDDIRHQNLIQQQEGVKDYYKPPEVKTTGNPYNVEIMDQWEGETQGAQYYQMSKEEQ